MSRRTDLALRRTLLAAVSAMGLTAFAAPAAASPVDWLAPDLRVHEHASRGPEVWEETATYRTQAGVFVGDLYAHYGNSSTGESRTASLVGQSFGTAAGAGGNGGTYQEYASVSWAADGYINSLGAGNDALPGEYSSETSIRILPWFLPEPSQWFMINPRFDTNDPNLGWSTTFSDAAGTGAAFMDIIVTETSSLLSYNLGPYNSILDVAGSTQRFALQLTTLSTTGAPVNLLQEVNLVEGSSSYYAQISTSLAAGVYRLQFGAYDGTAITGPVTISLARDTNVNDNSDQYLIWNTSLSPSNPGGGGGEVPEPAALAMLCAGGLALAVRRRVA